jgi:hypothetical protein
MLSPGHREGVTQMELEPLPDLAGLPDGELKQLIEDLTQAEREVSMQRRVLHGRIDMLRQELVRRLTAKDEGELSVVDVDALARILAGRLPDVERLQEDPDGPG